MTRGTLYLVSTPIGNLEDITVRAIDTLGSVDIIACEDTRRSAILLKRWAVSTKLMSLHRFSESRKTESILRRLERGENVALISDAGTPAVSDPGARVVDAALEAGFKVTPVPGPSSITAALSVSGIDGSSFVYLGFVPRKEKQRRAFFEEMDREERTSLFFETPKRIQATLRMAAGILGPRKMILMRELTKIHEETIPGTAQRILDELNAREAVKGEIIVVVTGTTDPPPEVDLEEAVKTLIAEGFSGKKLADEANKRFGLTKGESYRKFLDIKRQKEK